MRFMKGLILCGVVVVVVDFYMIYLAMQQPPQIEASYESEER